MSQAAEIVRLFFNILYWLIIIRVMLSWIPHNPDSPIIRLLYEGTEPILAPFRRIMPKGAFPLDFSPLLALLLLHILRDAVLRMLVR